MAKYEKDRKFYWLQLKEDFFEEGAIDWLEEQDNGIAYSHFYLKLCLKSLRDNGILIRKVGNVLIPYDAKKLSEITKTDLDTVIVAMELLKKIGLVKVFESGEIYLTQIENMIGSKSIGAFKKQQQRQLKKENDEVCLPESTSSGQMSEKCPPEIEIEIEQETRDKEKTSSVVVSNVEVFKHFEKCGFMVTPMLMEKISADIEVYGSQWLIDAATEALERGKINNYKYVIGIIQNWQTEGRDSKKNTKAINSKNQPKPLRFNNFEARDYDYDSLEKKLLGWEDNDNEHGED